MNIKLAPIILFVYSRPWHTRQCLDALAANYLASESELIVFSDGAKGQLDEAAVVEVRQLIRESTGFKSIKLIERQENIGLAQNILQGLSQIFEINNCAIVLEDDIICAPGFLSFMNEALCTFKDVGEIWHVNGWNYPILMEELPDVYCTRNMNCWGWATWADRWKLLNLDALYFMQKWSLKNKLKFNQDGTYPFYSHLISNYTGFRKTWAVFWYATIYDSHGLCVTPHKTLVNEIGSDGSGTHRLENKMYMSSLSDLTLWNFEELSLSENKFARAEIANFNKRHFNRLSRIFNTIKLFIPWYILRRKRN